MKKHINNKLYNTDTAQPCGEWVSPFDPDDPHHSAETLYRKRSGEYFLHGTGNASSKYAKSAGQDRWDGGESIQPLTLSAAKQWAGEKLCADEYEAVFGAPNDDAGRETLHLTLSAEARHKLEQARAETGKPISAIIAELVDAM